MTTTQAPPAALPSFDRVKMEERKRSLVPDADDLAQPRAKRLVKDEHGQAMRMDAEKERDVEVCHPQPHPTAPHSVYGSGYSNVNIMYRPSKKTPS